MRWAVALIALVLSTGPATAAEPDLELGEEIYEVCAPCHGPSGQGGGGGVYPRLAGLPIAYMTEQLRDFKRRLRVNIPMVPFANERELPEEDLMAVSAYLATLKLMTRMPDVDVPMDGLERLNLAKKVLQIPRAPGDLEAGKALYVKHCSKCHGEDGFGHKKAPGLAGQYTGYLQKQIDLMLDADREHRDADELFGELSAPELRDILAYLSILDDGLDY